MKKMGLVFIAFTLVFTFTSFSFGAEKFKPGIYFTQFPEKSDRPFVAYLTIGNDGKIAGLVFDFYWPCKDGDKLYPSSVLQIKERYGLSQIWCKLPFVKTKPVGEFYEQANALATAIVDNQGWDKDWKLYYKDWNKDGKKDFFDVLLFDDEKENGRAAMPDAVSGCTVHIDEMVIVWNKVIGQAQGAGGTASMALRPDGKPYMELGDAPEGGPQMQPPPCPWVPLKPSPCK